MERTILHCDLNCFFASVELREHPELKNLPVAVCGDPGSRHGIILAKNEAAKTFGIQTAETVWQARKKCPELLFLTPHHRRYRDISHAVNALYQEYTDRVEPFGVDESWLDVTAQLPALGCTGRELADTLRRRMREEFDLTISVGVSFNKVFAKLGSDYKKPDATTVITPADVPSIVWPLPVGALLFVGRATQQTLEPYGVKTIGDLARFSPTALEAMLGKQGRQLYEYANGLDQDPVTLAGTDTAPKSVGSGTTFSHNLTTWEELKAGVAILCDNVAMELRKNAMVCRTLQVTVRDPKFKDICRQRPLSTPSQFSRELSAAALEILKGCWKPGAPVRALTVTAQNLQDQADAFEQTSLFSSDQAVPTRAKQAQLDAAMDTIRAKYGKKAIQISAGAALLDRKDKAKTEL